jgi:signal transduction histidine kinase
MRLGRAMEADELGPWFRRRPAFAVSVAVALHAVVFALLLQVHATSESISLLFALPIALLASAFGARVGAAAGAAATLSIFTWVAIDGVTLSPFGWFTRTVPLVLLGTLIGGAADRFREAAQTAQRLVAAELRQREAAEINDSIIQRLAVAKWSIESGDTSRGIELLTTSIEAAEMLVADLLVGRAHPMIALRAPVDAACTAHLSEATPR